MYILMAIWSLTRIQLWTSQAWGFQSIQTSKMRYDLAQLFGEAVAEMESTTRLDDRYFLFDRSRYINIFQ